MIPQRNTQLIRWCGSTANFGYWYVRPFYKILAYNVEYILSVTLLEYIPPTHANNSLNVKPCHVTAAHIYYFWRQKVTAKHRSSEMENVGKEMDAFGKRSQMLRISVSRSLQACTLYSFSSFILAATFLSIFCKPAQPSTKCVGTSHHRNPVTVVKRSKSSSTYFQNVHCIGVVKSTLCLLYVDNSSESLLLVRYSM